MPSPTSTPSIPPSPASTVDSSRNCCRIARRVAPMALRMPISRVRSVTETSMMFATPIPPTTSEIAGDRAGEQREEGQELRRLVDEVLLGAGVEVAFGGVGDPVPLVEDRRHLLQGRGHGLRRPRGHDHRVDLVAAAEHVAAGGLQRHVRDVVVLRRCGDADHPERRAADPDALADRVAGVAREQFGDRLRSEHHDLGLRPLLLLVEERADDEVDVGDVGVVRRRAGDPCPVADLALLLQQGAARHQRRDRRDVRGQCTVGRARRRRRRSAAARTGRPRSATR